MAALSMPFLYRDRAHMFKVLDGPIGQELMESLQSQHLLGLCWFDAGFRNVYNSQREIKSPEDMKGLINKWKSYSHSLQDETIE